MPLSSRIRAVPVGVAADGVYWRHAAILRCRKQCPRQLQRSWHVDGDRGELGPDYRSDDIGELVEIFMLIARDCGSLNDPLEPRWLAQTTRPSPGPVDFRSEGGNPVIPESNDLDLLEYAAMPYDYVP